ncbi:MAG: hypothetical protein AAGC66_06895 [Leifsonia sp.]
MSDPTVPENERPAEGGTPAAEPQATPEAAPAAAEPTPAPAEPAPAPTAPDAQPQAAPEQPNPYAAAQPGPYGQPAAEKKKPVVPRWVWWVIGGALAFAAVVIVAIVLLVNLLGGSGAKSVAQEYLNDIAKGNASAANKLARLDAGDEDFLLTDKVLGQAKRITAPTATRALSSRNSDLTQVSVTYKLAGKSYRGTIELDKDDKGWYVSRGLTYQLPYVSSTIPGFSVPGAEHSITSADSDTQAYPGVYTIEAPNKFYELDGSPVLTVAADTYQLKNLKLTPSKAYLDEVQKQVDAHYAECAAKTSYYDVEDCGIELSYPSNIAVSSSTVAVKVDESPKVAIDDADSYYQFKIGPGKFSAVITGKDFSGNPATESLTGAAGYISADIKIDGDKVVVTFN